MPSASVGTIRRRSEVWYERRLELAGSLRRSALCGLRSLPGKARQTLRVHRKPGPESGRTTALCLALPAAAIATATAANREDFAISCSPLAPRRAHAANRAAGCVMDAHFCDRFTAL